MTGYGAFVKKEFMEFYRSHKLLIILAVFLLLGMMNPLTAKITPQLVENFMPEGMIVDLGEPTALDSWMQFYKNVPQLGLVVLVILFSGMMSQEYSKGTLINMLTKGLARRSVVLSKLTVALVMWTAAYAICAGISWAYTAYFWKGEVLHHLFSAAVLVWIYGILLLAVGLFGSVLCKNAYGNLLITGGFVGIQFLLNIIPDAVKYNPVALISRNMELIEGSLKYDELLFPIVITAGLAIAFVIAACAVFNKKTL